MANKRRTETLAKIALPLRTARSQLDGIVSGLLRVVRAIVRGPSRLLRLARLPQRRKSVTSAIAATPVQGEGAAPDPSVFAAHQPEGVDRRKGVTAVSILDTFTQRCLDPELNLVPLSRGGWQREIGETRPDFLLAESAWQGNSGDWRYTMSQFARRRDNPLRDLLAWCQENNLTTVFWNKEDPPNYDVFIDVAREFDIVFTSDAESIDRYHKDLGHDRVYALPFAAQPALHNPLEAHALRELNVCFAGTWYGNKYPERRADMELLLDPGLEHGLHIFDRQHGKEHDGRHTFPERYQPAIQGSLEYDEMLTAYRAYRVFLNVNSAPNSSTMVARRVFELLACGTSVISSRSVAIDRFFGELVATAGNADDTRRWLERLLSHTDYRERLAHLGYRHVLSHHTYRHRIETVLSIVGHTEARSEPPRVAVLARVADRGQLERALAMYQSQVHTNRRLCVAIASDGNAREPLRRMVSDSGVASIL
jgi:spore maturation protein CgeB